MMYMPSLTDEYTARIAHELRQQYAATVPLSDRFNITLTEDEAADLERLVPGITPPDDAPHIVE